MTGPSRSEIKPADPVTIGMVAHCAFCPRRAWLEAAGEHTDSWQVAEGVHAHHASDDRTRSRPGSVRAVDVASTELGVVGRCDTVHVLDDGSVELVEHKATPIRRDPRVTEPMRVQLVLQRHGLTEAGYDVRSTGIWFSSHSTFVNVELDESDERSARELVEQTRAVLDAEVAPPPLEDDIRCSSCSHISVCLPDERSLGPVTRAVSVADPDGQVVHLSTFGARASTRGGRLLVHRHGEQMASLPLERVQGVVVHGNVDMTGGLIRELLHRDTAVVWCTSGGRVVGWAQSASSPNGGPRARQAVASQDGRLDLAREMVSAKVSGQATLLRRGGGPPAAVATLRGVQRRAQTSTNLQHLLGLEGEAASVYFEHFAVLIKSRVREEQGLSFPGRRRRPATDPLNAALNYAYALLVVDTTRAILACGLDPHHGFLHSSGRNKPALALDLAEEMRAPVADSTVLGAFNNGELAASDFSSVLGAVSLRDKGRKALITAYERRVTSTFRHPTFGYTVSWRRAMEVQARLVLGVIDGSMATYRGIRTR